MSLLEGVDALPPCRPPREFEGYRWHWVVAGYRPPEIAIWRMSPGGEYWHFSDLAGATPYQASLSGWRYVAPAIPPEVGP